MEDQEYIKKRNKLINLASRHADEITGNPYAENWDREFIREMDKLAVQTGIQEVRYHR